MTYEELTSFTVLYEAYLTARKGKRKKNGTAEYEANALACTHRLQCLLREHRYKPSKFEVFTVYEPKKRLIQAPAFVDKVLLHAVVDNVLYDLLCHSFIRDNCASQKKKGTHDALGRLKMQMARYYRRHGTADGWVLKGDVRHFFASIDHDKLKKKLRAIFVKHGADLMIYDLLCIYIDASDGLPLGYQTSQLLALMFLDDFDHYVVETLGYSDYGRYMDDFHVIAETKDELRVLLGKINAWMADVGLELNEKTCIHPLKNGIDYLGFHTYLTESGAVVQKLRQDNIDRINARVKSWKRDYPLGRITKERIIEKFRGWDAYAAYGDTYALRLKYARIVSEIIGEEIKPRRKISSTQEARGARLNKQARHIYRKRHPECGGPADFRNEPAPDDVPPWM